MRPSTTFAVSKDRGNQLRTIALSKRISVAELIANWIDRELQELDLPTELAVVDIAIEADGDKVTLSAELFGKHTLRLDPAQAGHLAGSIEKVITDGGTLLDATADFVTVSKRGTGIIIEHETFSRSMPVYEAREIAKELSETAAQYSKAVA